MSPVRRLLVAALPVLILTAGGCAKGGSAPTKEQYAEAANQVCKDSATAIDAVYMDQAVAELREATMPDTELGDDLSIYIERPERWIRARVVPAYRNLSNALKSIVPPDGEAAYLTDLYADLDRDIDTLHRLPSEGRAAIEADELLRERFASYGMDACPPPLDPEPAYEDPAEVLKALDAQVKAEESTPEVVNPQDAGG